MRYIGPFFRMNSLSQSEISNQLFFLSRESIKSLVLNSKCGLVNSTRSSKKTTSTNDISILNNFSPLLCIYKKSSPLFVHNKTSHGFDDSTFKREISPTTNSLMTLCLLELGDYYSNYNDKNIASLKDAYNFISRGQLDFYYEHLRNSEGVFVSKKNISENSSKGFNLIEKEKKFNFVDQAFMMNAYYLYSIKNKEDEISKDYKNFALEILQMFVDFKESLYNLSFEEICKLLFAFNIFYSYSKDEKCHSLIMDLGEYSINKFNERDYYIEELDNCSLLALCLKLSFENIGLISFKEKYEEIMTRLLNLYDEEKGIFIKLKDKKNIKYSCLDISFYLLAILCYCKNENSRNHELNGKISVLYRRLVTSSGIIASWPDAPTIDEIDRYRSLSLKSEDMFDESYFKMPNLPTPESNGLAPIFFKSVSYSRKKDTFKVDSDSLDTYKNMFIFFTTIYLLKSSTIELNFPSPKDIDSESDCVEKIDDKDVEIIIN